MDKLTAGISKACQGVLWVTMTVIFGILCANTLLRYISGQGLQWANEVPEMLFPWLVMSGVVLAAIHGSHIATTFLRDRMNPGARRKLSMVVWAAVSVLYATLSVATTKMLPIVHDEKSPILGVPASVTFGCVLLGMLCLMLLAIMDLVRSIQSTAADHHAETPPNAHY